MQWSAPGRAKCRTATRSSASARRAGRAALREDTEFSLNVLLREPLDLARVAGTKHSIAVNKLAGVPLETRSGVLWLTRAKKRMRCRVERFLDVAPDGATRGVLVEILPPVEEQEGDALLLDEVFRAA